MKLTDLSVGRPVLATVMSLVILLLGVIAFTRLSVREYPMIDTPVVSVRTIYRGASAEIMESQVSQPMEDELSGIEGIDVMKSVSREEVSEITVKFRLTRDPDDAAADVRDRVARARNKLPQDVDEPVISKVEADADPIMWLAFYSDRHSPLEVSDFADRVVRDRLQTIPGVATVLIGGERRYSMRLWLDRERLAGYGLTPLDVETALRRENIEVPSGRIESTEREFTVLSETDLRTPEQFDQMIIREVNGYPVRLKDVGHAALGAEDERSGIRVDGSPAVGMGVVKQSTANLLEVARAIKVMLPEIQATLPPGMQFKIGTDRSSFVEDSIRAVYQTLFEALALVVVVIFVFLRSPRATLIPFLSIPVAIIGAFFFLYALDFSINILTLLALVLAMTITLVAVFVPMAFQTGTTGRLFREFALAVAGAVAVSGFVALTLVPMLCGRILRHSSHNAAYRFTERFFVALNRAYEATLRLALRGWVLVVMLALAVGGVGAWMFTQLQSELSPFEDRSDFVVLMLGPEGATYDYMYRNVLQAEKVLEAVPEMTTLFMVVSPGVQRPAPVNVGASFATIKPWGERTRGQFDITRELGPKLGALPGVLAFPINRASLGMGGYRETPVQFVLQADTWEQLQGAVDGLMARASQNPALLNLDTDLKLNKPQLKVDVNRDKLANVGITAADVGRTLETLLGGREVTRFKRAGKQYDVIVKLADDARRQPTDLTDIYLRAGDGSLVQVDNLVSLREAVAPRELNHFNRLRAAKISANIAPGHAMGEVLDWLAAEARQILPPGGRIDYDGVSREFKEASQALALTFGLALVFIYLVLSAQFESFRDPLVILLSVPLAIAGAVAALYVTGLTLNVYSQIGMVMLIGLTAKNGILIVEFTRQLRAGGMAARDALVQASVLRLRPILMTSATMLLAAVPLAFASGAGAETRHPIGWVIIGGLLIGTLFSLYVVPVVYLLLSGREATPRVAARPLQQPA